MGNLPKVSGARASRTILLIRGIAAVCALLCFGSTSSCALIDLINKNKPGKPGAFPGNPGFPGAGGRGPANPSDGPEGNDALSSSTNHSEKIGDSRNKASGASGVTFIAPPDISNHGDVGLNYPIEVPAGRAGLQPQIALSYSSSGGDGWVGIGWNLGLGAISRTTQYGQLYYDKRDTFTYGGKRLIKVSGSSANEDGVYRQEIESGFLRFELTGISSGGVWTVYDRNGTITTYGSAQSTRIYHPDSPNLTYSWYLERTQDLNGNYMQVSYDDSEYAEKHILYLKEIRYTGNANAGYNPRQYVRFHLRDRSDFYVSKAPGFVMKMDKLLDSIETGYNSSTLWEYRMVYATSPDSGRPLLKNVDSTRTTTIPEFFYQVSEHLLSWVKIPNADAGLPETNPESTQYFEGDFNGDGISDMVFFNPDNGVWRAAEGKRGGGYNFKTYATGYRGYDGSSKIQWFKGNVTGDYNGDGRSDIAFYLPETREFWVAEGTGTGLSFKSYGRQFLASLDIFKTEWFPGDFDGNGLSDSLLFDEPTGNWILMRNLGGSFDFKIISNHFQNLFREDYRANVNLNSPATRDSSLQGKSRSQVQFWSGDYNGDGRSDLSFYDARDGKWWVGENHLDPSGGGSGFTIVWKLYKTFTAPEQALFGHDRFSGDFNGDGFSDFLVFNRDTGEWIIGETQDGTINFRVFSRTPQHKEITRWLQGDFNGDGRTDIGFYSATDNNFWIGEATSAGFRYRIYNNLSYGPDPARVMATPLPRDEVKLEKDTAVFASGSSETAVLDYTFDGNSYGDRGERVFPGCFTKTNCAGTPELLIFDRRGDDFYLKTNTSFSQVYADENIEATDRSVLFGGRAQKHNAKDEVLFYKKYTSGVNNIQHEFWAFGHNGTSGLFAPRRAVQVNDTNFTNFDIKESLVLVDHWTGAAEWSALILDDQAATATFKLASSGGFQPLNPTGAISNWKDIFKNGTGGTNRSNRAQISFFSGAFNGAGTQVLMVDRRSGTHRWYLGTISGATINFVSLSGNPQLPQAPSFDNTAGGAGVPYFLQGTSNQAVVLAATTGQTLRYYRISVSGGSISLTATAVPDGYTDRGEFTNGSSPDPVVRGASGPMRFSLSQARLEALGAASYKFERPDLMTKVYPFQWIQGDYNGDGKTDIGIFHRTEPVWYFALSVGDVPDILHKVKNGIGGSYTFEYANSTSFDNTGADGLPHLPMNYRVCVKKTVEDGFVRSIATTYEYKGGYAFSSFINGRKETDYFGFSDFRVIDAYGARTINTYNTTPKANFLENRALGGAIQQSIFIGYDNQEYSRTNYDYIIHHINQGGAQNTDSYLVEAVQVRKYVKGTIVQTQTAQTNLVSGRYAVANKTESVTDHFADTAHPSVTLGSYSEFLNNDATNEQRVIVQKNLTGTAQETTTNLTYDGRGNLTRKQVASSGGGPATPDRINNYDYDNYGNKVRETNASGSPGRVTDFLYDDTNQFVVQLKQYAPSMTLVSTTGYDYASAFGKPSLSQDPNGNSRYFEYDGYGRLTRVRADTESGQAVLTEYAYTSDFPLSAKTTQYTGGTPIYTRVYTDGLGRDIHSVQSGDAGRFTRSGLVVYDAVGRVIRKSQTDWADPGEIDAFRLITLEKHPTTTEYDSSGRVCKVTLPRAENETQETSITTSYNDPWEVTTLHSIGRGKTTVKNARGQVLSVEDFGQGDTGSSVSAKIGFCFDASGNRVKKMDTTSASLSCAVNTGTQDHSGNNEASWLYDAFGELRNSSDPDLGVSSFAYNAFGDLASSTDGKNQTTTYQYDTLGRMTQKTLPNGEGVVSYVYDNYSGSANAKGRLVAIDDPAQKKELSYDRLGHVAVETRYLKGLTDQSLNVAYITRTQYDLLDRVTQIDYPRNPKKNEGIRTCYGYNAFGVTNVMVNTKASGSGCSENQKTIVTGVQYNEFGQIAQQTQGNGVTTAYTYDIKGRMMRLVTTGDVGGTTKKFQDVSYTFNVQNSIKDIQNNATDYQTRYEYSYDGLNRLIAANGDYKETPNQQNTQGPEQKYKRAYDYAPNGNLTAKTIYDPTTNDVTDQWTYAYDNHQAIRIDSTRTGSGRIRMAYDAVGNMTSQINGAQNLEKEVHYNSQNRISRVINPQRPNQLVGQYWYDDQGFRVRKLARFDRGQGKNLEDVEILYTSKFFGMEITSAFTAVNNIYLNGVRVAAVTPNGGAVFYLTDQVDSVKLILDDNKAEVSRLEYLPYGETFVQKGNKDYAPKYNSQELDPETKFYFYNARYYDPEVARFTSADTVVPDELNTQSWNRFTYTLNSPIQYKDPTGHIPLDEIADVAFIIYDAGSLIYHAATGDSEAAKDDAVALGADLLGAAIPYATGLGVLSRAERAAERAQQVTSAAQKAEKGAEKVKKAEQASKKADSAVQSSTKPAPKQQKPVNGNSNASTKPQHRYEIRNKETKDVVKTGISGQPLNKNGTSPRANPQVKKANKNAGSDTYEAVIVEKNIPTRAQAKQAEQEATNALHSQGNSLQMQKLPKPQK